MMGAMHPGAWLVAQRARTSSVVAFGALVVCAWPLGVVNTAHAQTLAAEDRQAPGPPAVAPTNAEHVAVILWTRDPGEVLSKLAQWAQHVGGRLLATEGERATAEIPRARFGEAMERLAALGDVEQRSVEARDLQLAQRATTAQLTSAREALERLRSLAQRPGGVEERLMVEREREAAELRVAALERELGRLEQQAARIRIHIELRRPTSDREARLPFPWLDALGLERLRTIDFQVEPRDDRVLRVAATGGVLLSGFHVEDPDQLGGTANALALTGTIRYMGEANPVGLVGGYDVALGAGGGFLYGLRFMGGLGAPFGKRFHVLLTTGLSADGITGDRIPFGVSMPLELHAGFDWGASLYTAVWTRPAWVLGSDARQNGSASTLFGDEMSSALFTVWGNPDDGQLEYVSTGLGAGFVYTELLDTRVYELRIGWGAMRADYSYSR
jgi:hypothetical protein